MTVSEIYTKYDIPLNLQEHMYRVAAVAESIARKIPDLVNVDRLVRVCLVHDMGNIIKFDMEKYPPQDPRGVEYWVAVQKRFIDTYGAHEKEANHAIAKELGLDQVSLRLLEGGFGFPLTCEILESEDYERKICTYADQRVAIDGVVPMQDRLERARVRYGFEKSEFAERMIGCYEELEQQLAQLCSFEPNTITDESIQGYMDQYPTLTLDY